MKFIARIDTHEDTLNDASQVTDMADLCEARLEVVQSPPTRKKDSSFVSNEDKWDCLPHFNACDELQRDQILINK